MHNFRVTVSYVKKVELFELLKTTELTLTQTLNP